MSKKPVKQVIVVVFMLVLISNWIVLVTTDQSLLRYFWDKNQLTDEDRAYLKAHGPIVYASDNNSPPLRFYDETTNQYAGIVIDYLGALAIELETEIQLKPMVWEAALESLKKGESDLCDMYPSEQRAGIYLFSDPIYYQRGVILVRKENDTIFNADDLSQKKVALQTGDYAYEFLNKNVPNIQYRFGIDYEVNLQKLVDGKVDAIVGDEPVISYFIDQYNLSDVFKIVDVPLYELPSVLSLNSSDKKLQQIINKGIKQLTEKKLIEKIQQKWYGISTPIGSPNEVNPFTTGFVTVIFITTGIAVFIFVWNLGLKKAVDEQTNALKMSKDNLQNLLDGLKQWIVVVSNNLQVHSGNAAFYAFFDKEEREVFQLDELIPGISTDIKAKWLYRYEGSELIVKGKTFLVTPCPVQYDDNPYVTTMLIFEDITDKKITEKRMLRENKMAAVGQLATGVAHEIRNPLGLIRNYIFLMKKKPRDEALRTQAISVIESSVDKASEIIDNLLNFSRLSNESKTQVDLKQFLENMIQLNDKVMNKKKLTYHLVLEDVSIVTNEEALKHIFINLIGNAVDAISESGHLCLWLKKAPHGAVVKVIDTGHGMSEETIGKLFDPFFSTKNVGEGTGLGLYITYSELNKIGGKIDVLSKVGKGTTFIVQLIDEGGQHEAKSL